MKEIPRKRYLMTQTPAQIKKVLAEGEFQLNKEPAPKKCPCKHEWRVYKQRKGIQFYRCCVCGLVSD